MLFKDGSLAVVLTQRPYTTALHTGSFVVVLTQPVDEGGIPQQVVSQSVSASQALEDPHGIAMIVPVRMTWRS